MLNEEALRILDASKRDAIRRALERKLDPECTYLDWMAPVRARASIDIFTKLCKEEGDERRLSWLGMGC